MKVYRALEREIKTSDEHYVLVGVMTEDEMDKLNDCDSADEGDKVIQDITGGEYGYDDFRYFATEREVKGKLVDNGWYDHELLIEEFVGEFSGEIK